MKLSFEEIIEAYDEYENDMDDKEMLENEPYCFLRCANIFINHCPCD